MATSEASTIPPSNIIEAGSVNIPLAEFPPTASLDHSSSAADIASKLVGDFNQALTQKDVPALSQLFLQNSYWRDHLALSWDFHTLHGREKISSFLSREGMRLFQVELDASTPFRAPHFGPIDAGLGETKGIEFFIKFTTDVGAGRGIARLAEESAGKWGLFMLSTTLYDLTGHDRGIHSHRPVGLHSQADSTRRNWQETRATESNFEDKEPQAIIVGAGQAGLSVAACLKMLGVDALVIDREDRIGDNWRNRYRHLVLHDPVYMDHLNYVPFPPSWPVFTPKDKFADFLESYAKLLELNVWTKTNLVSSSWDENTKQWSVTVETQQEDGTKKLRILRPNHVILATGQSGKKYFPSIKGIHTFKGDICHSSEFKGAKPNSKGRKAVVIGCGNSGHDISQDFYEQGYDVTMVQRSSTFVISSNVFATTLVGFYSEDSPPTEDVDQFLLSMPFEVLKAVHVKAARALQQADSETLQGLEKVGFKLDSGPDSAGLVLKFFQRGGGYYINVGTSKLIADGKINIKQGQEISQITPHAIEFADGSVLEADEIVFATGYQNMRTEARSIFGDTVADRIGDIWGFDEEGELRSVWRPSGHPGFWYAAGNLWSIRYYSKLLALQIKAIEEGLNKSD